MNIDYLVEMANDIGNYFTSEPEQEEAINGILNHLQRFWEDRMQIQIVDYMDEGGDELSPLVKEAVTRLKNSFVETK